MADPRVERLIALSDRSEKMISALIAANIELRRRICALEAANFLRDRDQKPPLPIMFRSQYGEDVILWDLFQGQPTGFFIEVGAYDGLSFSVSYAFEAFGWDGLLIEALPERYQACAANRPGSRVVHAALGRRGSSGTTSFTAVQGTGIDDMMSYRTTDALHLQVVAGMRGARPVQVTVPLTTMNDLLTDHAGIVDFAVIDVEGGELDVLDGFDLERYRPRVLVVEDNHQGSNSAFNAGMDRLPYQFIARAGVSAFFIRKDDTVLMERAKRLRSGS